MILDRPQPDWMGIVFTIVRTTVMVMVVRHRVRLGGAHMRRHMPGLGKEQAPPEEEGKQ